MLIFRKSKIYIGFCLYNRRKLIEILIYTQLDIPIASPLEERIQSNCKGV